ncbi:MAG: hypothetical protein FWC05_04705 [Treponema sp.]|nr:hypothetical protein [Treponema sp.]
MIFIVLVVSAAGSILLGILFNKVALKNYPNNGKKEHYFITVAAFLFTIVIASVAISAGANIKSAINRQSAELEEYVTANHSDLAFVKNGLNLTEVSENLSQLNSSMDELKNAVWPQANQIGIPRIIFNYAAGFATNEIQKRLLVANTAEKKANAFADENNYITVSSIMNGLRNGIVNIVNVVVIVIVSVCALILCIHILVSLLAVKKEKERLAGEPAPQS